MEKLFPGQGYLLSPEKSSSTRNNENGNENEEPSQELKKTIEEYKNEGLFYIQLSLPN